MANLVLSDILKNLAVSLRLDEPRLGDTLLAMPEEQTCGSQNVLSRPPRPGQPAPATQGIHDLVFSGVCTDTRMLRPGELFVALSGANFDGHDFIATAIECGAAGVVCRHWPHGLPERPVAQSGQPLAVLIADDTLVIYQALAGLFRKTLKVPVVAVTGSVGKTSTRSLVAACLASRLNVHQTKANLNNEIGLPATLLATPPDAEAVVVEMGMRAAGEIRVLTRIARPDIAIVTNIGHSHIEYLGSQEGILRAKLEIVEGLAPGGLLILNGDDPLLRRAGRELIAQAAPFRVAFISVQEPCAEPGAAFCLYATDIVPSMAGVRFQAHLLDDSGATLAEAPVEVGAPGLHQVVNGLFGLMCAHALGLGLADGASGAAGYQNTGSRQRIVRIDTLTVMDDSYNASPESMEAAMATMKSLAEPNGGRLVAALGGMLELGPYTREGHERVGRATAANGFAAVFVTGGEAEDVACGAHAVEPNLPVFTCPDVETLIGRLIPAIHDHDFILVKGSRGFRMEQVVNALENYAAARGLDGEPVSMDPCANTSEDPGAGPDAAGAEHGADTITVETTDGGAQE